MSKIKEGIPLRILLSYGFVYNKEYKEYNSEDSYTAKFCIEADGELARILRISDDIYDSEELEVLFDLITDGLIEKVED